MTGNKQEIDGRQNSDLAIAETRPEGQIFNRGRHRHIDMPGEANDFTAGGRRYWRMGGMFQAAAYQLNQFFVFDPLGFTQHLQIKVGGLTKGSGLL